MKHSKRVHRAAQQVFAELLALTPEELSECLSKRDAEAVEKSEEPNKKK